MSAETQTAPRVGAHRKSRPSAAKVHGKRITWFSLIGAFVFVMGTSLQWMLIREGDGTTWSYAWQAVFSVELSFALNRTLTWGDRSVGVMGPLVKWNVQKLALSVPNFAAYALLVHAGLSWLAANLAVTAVFTVLNYIGGDLWSFREHRVSPLHWAMGIAWCFLAPVFAVYAVTRSVAIVLLGSPARQTAPETFAGSQQRGIETLAGLSGAQEMERRAGTALPTVSVVIPCKGNERTIRATVEALLNQDYAGLREVICVGDTGDSTWAGLVDVTDDRLVILEQELTPGKRDPNVKRDKGLRKASGEILALADSDIVMDPDWLSLAVPRLLAQGGGVVAGGMTSIHDSYWGRFTDHNVIARKTPRIPRPYQVTMANFGKSGTYPPVTANAVFTRDVYDAEGLDVTWAYGYEDYEWFWRIAKAGFTITFAPDITGAHHHRRSFRKLVTEYRRSANGCSHFIRAHGDSPLARKRRRQALVLPIAAAGGVAMVGAMAARGMGAAVAFGLACAAALLMAREITVTKRLEAAGYPFAGFALAAIFTWGLSTDLMRRGTVHQVTDTAPIWDTSDLIREPLWRRARRRISWPLTAILAVQAAFSLSLVWSNTAFGDEALYLGQGRDEWAHWLHGTPLPFVFHDSGSVYIYPPIGGIADYLGGLAAARILSLTFMLTATYVLYAIGKGLLGRPAALWGCALWAVSEPVLRLAFATYDPLACLMIILSVYLAVRAADSSRRAEVVLASAACAALGALTAVSFAIYLPVVAGIALCVHAERRGWKQGIMVAVWLGATATLFFLFAMIPLHMWQDFIGSVYTRGATAKFVGNGLGQGLSLIVRSAWSWDGLLVCVAAIGVLFGFTACGKRSPRSWLLASLFAAGVAVPLYQAHLGTAFSMDKHVSAGSGLAALAAGYALSQVRVRTLSARAAAVASVALIAFPALTGLWYARSTYHMWPDIGPTLPVVQHLESAHHGAFIAGGNNSGGVINVFGFSLPSVSWTQSPNLSGIASGEYSGAIESLNAAPLDNGKFPTAAVTNSPSLVSEIIAASGDSTVVDALENSRWYSIYRIVPYRTANSSDSAGVFIIWRHV